MKKSFILSLALLGLGCGVDAGSVPPPTVVDADVWNSSVQTLVAEDHGGGFAPQAPPGSTCVLNAKKFTLTVATRGVVWTRCVGSGTTTPYKEDRGSRALTDAEFKDLAASLEKLRVVKPNGYCIADASLLTIDTTNPLGSQQYIDDGYQCNVKDKPLLDRGAIAAVIDRFNKLAVPTS